MPLKNYLIGPFQAGLERDLEPWLLPEDAFATLENAYVWRGRVRKRWGYSLIGTNQLNSQLRMQIGTTNGSGNLSVTVPGSIYAVGQKFSVADQIFTVVTSGAASMLSTGAGTGTYNTASGAVSITGAAANTAVYFYPSTPVMGLRLRENSNINFEEVVAFDQQFSYIRLAGAWSALTGRWSSNTSQFIWTTNYRSSTPDITALWATNYKRFSAGTPDLDGIKYLDQGTTTWNTLRPQLNTTGTIRYLDGCLLLVGFKDRLIALNTLESGAGNPYRNRARWCQNGNPTDATNGWDDTTPGRGGYIDASTQEAIITAEFIKDSLIVYFERSTWELKYTGNAILPFRWQVLNTELGCESTFSIVGFDSGAVGVGNVGIHTCDGVSVSRIDQKIPNEVFQIHNNSDGPQRVYGIRDYYNELVYWTFPNEDEEPTFPNKVLIWNYQNGSWAFFKDSFTCFGYFQSDSPLTWATIGQEYETWQAWSTPWGSGQNQAQFVNIIAGTRQGMVVNIRAEDNANAPCSPITNMDTATQVLTILNHNLETGDFVKVSNVNGVTLNQDGSGNDITVFKVVRLTADTIGIDNTTATPGVDAFGWTGTYRGGGLLGRVSKLNIISKQWNPGTPVGQQFRMPYIDFLLDRTANGEVIVDYQTDFSGWTIQSQDVNNALLGSNVLYTKPEDAAVYQPYQQRIWHRYFMQTQGQTIQIQITQSDTQMRNPTNVENLFTINSMILYVEPQGRITG
jgi:hypothetical protein